jgi:surface antigen
MSQRFGERSLPAAVAGCTLVLLGACAQNPRPASGDPAYNGLAPRAEVLARNTVQEALETARSTTSLSWSYVEGGSSGEITPLRTYRTTAGFYCREYVEVIESSADGRRSRQRTACRDSDGRWKPIRS